MNKSSNRDYECNGEDPENFIEILAKVMYAGVDVISTFTVSSVLLQYNKFGWKMERKVKSLETINDC